MTKKLSLLVCAFILSAGLTGCLKDDNNRVIEITSGDEALAGDVVTVGDTQTSVYKLFVVNEGQRGKDNASVDFLRFKDGKYVRNAYSQMNSGAKLGDIAQDCKVYYNSIWVPVTNSGIVEVFSAIDEKKLSTFKVPTARSIAFYDQYAFVTSHSGAVYGGDKRVGAVYRIELNNGSVKDSVHVGYQPEGIAAGKNGNIYVANSGGYTEGLDNRLSVVNLSSFSVTDNIEVAVNLKDVFYDYNNDIVWTTSMGDFYANHSGVYAVNALNRKPIARKDDLVSVRYLCAAFPYDGYLYVIGDENEFDWAPDAVHTYNLYKINSASQTVESKTPFASSALGEHIGRPYSILVNPINGDIYIGDAGDYQTPGKVACFTKDLAFKWEATSGVNPSHMALHAIAY